MSLYDQFQSSQKGTPAKGGLYAQFQASQNPEPSLFQKGVEAVKGYVADSTKVAQDFTGKVTEFTQHPLQGVVDFGNTVSAPAKTAFTNTVHAAYDLATDKGVANKVADTAHLISGVAQSAFSPITGAFNAAEATPVLKQAADVLNIVPTYAGLAGSFATGKAIDVLPIPQASKDIIKAPLQEVGSLAGQILLGGKIMEKIGGLSKKGETVTPEKAQAIVDEAKKEVAAPRPGEPAAPSELYKQYKSETVPVEPKTAQEFIAEQNKKTSLTISDETRTKALSGISDEKRLTSTEPVTIYRAGTGEIKPGDFVTDSKAVADSYAKQRPGTTVNTVDVSGDSLVKSGKQNEYVYAPKEPKIAKSAADINDTLAQKGFDQIPESQAAQYTSTTKAEQVHFVSKLLDDPERAKNIVRGNESLPSHVLEQPFFNAMEAYAIEHNDPQLLIDLGKSPMATRLSEAGQTLGSHGYTDNPNSALRRVQDISKTRQAAVERKSGYKYKKAEASTAKQAEVELYKSGATKRVDWETFIKDLTCGY